MIEVAKLNAVEQNLPIDYRLMDSESLAATQANQFDVVSCMGDARTRSSSGRATVATLAQLVRSPGGSVFISTINRNLKSFLLAIVGAEYLMKLIPPGTHEYDRLIKPAELAAWGRAAGLTALRDVAGAGLQPVHRMRCQLDERSLRQLSRSFRARMSERA